MDRRFLSDQDLAKFITRYESLKSEGRSTSEIARLLGVHRNTVNGRLLLWSKKKDLVYTPSV